MRMNRKHSKPIKTNEHYHLSDEMLNQGPFI
jgi:hypothetical protein